MPYVTTTKARTSEDVRAFVPLVGGCQSLMRAAPE